MLPKAISALTGFIAVAAFCASTSYAQGTAGTWVFHWGPSGVCPGLDWHVNSDGRNLSGLIAWDQGKSVARVSGTVANGEAKLIATEIGGGKTANIIGRIQGGSMLNATITGTSGPCDGKTIKVPWMSSSMMGGEG
jgi:hypothetical protein